MDSRLIEALKNPETYPEKPGKITHMETHISHIFLTGKHAYKIKKPVNFGFLDFSTLEKRRHFCQEELRLNRRFSSGLYLGIQPICQHRGSINMEGKGVRIEYAVKMRELEQSKILKNILARGEAGEALIREVAASAADAYSRIRTSAKAAKFGTMQTIFTNWDENFSQTRKYIGLTIEKDRFFALMNGVGRFMTGSQHLLSERIAKGMVKECHGDLHSGNIFADKGIQIFDCIEFNERFRYQDVASDIAFFSMDLDHHGYPDLARVFEQEYAERSGDDIWPLLNFYKCYRAYVRGKVTSFLLDQLHGAKERENAVNEAKKYFGLASFYSRRTLSSPTIIAVSGLIGSGKSTLAGSLSRELNAEVISSDTVRKEAAKGKALEPYGKGLYSREARDAVYTKMHGLALERLKAGRSVILDATYMFSANRRQAIEISRSAGARFLLINCTCPDEVALGRMDKRLVEKSDSDGRRELYHSMKAGFEPFGGLQRLDIDTIRPEKEAIEMVMDFLEKH